MRWCRGSAPAHPIIERFTRPREDNPCPPRWETTRSPGAAPLGSERFAADPALVNLASGGAPSIGTGASGDAVKRLQLALVEIGFSVGRAGADGRYGSGTTAAVTSFQRAASLPATGAVDAATLHALDARVRATDHPPPPALAEGTLDSPRFASDPVFRALAAGGKAMSRGASGAAVEKLQWTLISLGFELPRHGADGSWGAETDAAVRAFQKSVKVAESALLDRATLLQLDDAAARRRAELRVLTTAPEEKPLRWRLLVDLVRCRIHVVERGGRHAACYLTSPGIAEFPTKGERFTLRETRILSWWRPPPAEWAKDLDAAPPGMENPMGICKLWFGKYAQYFHGIPRYEEPDLGRHASHGCLRMSGSNILEFHQLYAGPGSDVQLTRDAKVSGEWAAAQKAAGVSERPIAAGREYLALYLYGEMGVNEQLQSDGRVTQAGRG